MSRSFSQQQRFFFMKAKTGLFKIRFDSFEVCFSSPNFYLILKTACCVKDNFFNPLNLLQLKGMEKKEARNFFPGNLPNLHFLDKLQECEVFLKPSATSS